MLKFLNEQFVMNIFTEIVLGFMIRYPFSSKWKRRKIMWYGGPGLMGLKFYDKSVLKYQYHVSLACDLIIESNILSQTEFAFLLLIPF